MRVIDAALSDGKKGLLTYGLLMKAYFEAWEGRDEPEYIEASRKMIALILYRLGSIPTIGEYIIRTPITDIRFHKAGFKESVEVPVNEVWFTNPSRPDLDVKIINIGG